MTKVISSIFLAIGLIVGGFFPGYYYYQAKINNNSVTVKGLSEMNVRADTAIWKLKFVITGNELAAAQKKITAQAESIYEFLQKQGFKDDEIKVGRIETNDLMANPYRSNDVNNSRFILSQTITVKTGNVDLVEKSLPETDELISNPPEQVEIVDTNSVQPE